MNTPAVFSVASKCFVDLGEQDYEELVSPEVWNVFLAEIAQAESGVLAERLAARELVALENPPSFEEHGRFCRRHFTGGLPESAMPVESLYRPWRESGAAKYGPARHVSLGIGALHGKPYRPIRHDRAAGLRGLAGSSGFGA